MADVPFTPNQRFRHGKEQYEPGDPVQVDEKLAYYFQMNGWGTSPAFDETPAEQPGEVTLEVQDAGSEQAAEEVR